MATVGIKNERERPNLNMVVRDSLRAGSRCPVISNLYSACSHQTQFTSVEFQLASSSVQLILARLNSKQLLVSLRLPLSLPHSRYVYSCGHLGSVHFVSLLSKYQLYVVNLQVSRHIGNSPVCTPICTCRRIPCMYTSVHRGKFPGLGIHAP